MSISSLNPKCKLFRSCKPFVKASPKLRILLFPSFRTFKALKSCLTQSSKLEMKLLLRFSLTSFLRLARVLIMLWLRSNVSNVGRFLIAFDTEEMPLLSSHYSPVVYCSKSGCGQVNNIINDMSRSVNCVQDCSSSSETILKLLHYNQCSHCRYVRHSSENTFPPHPIPLEPQRERSNVWRWERTSAVTLQISRGLPDISSTVGTIDLFDISCEWKEVKLLFPMNHFCKCGHSKMGWRQWSWLLVKYSFLKLKRNWKDDDAILEMWLLSSCNTMRLSRPLNLWSEMEVGWLKERYYSCGETRSEKYPLFT